MPRASEACPKRWLKDYDSDVVDETPPVQNTWYEVFHAEDVRLIWCVVIQDNDETDAKDVEVRWTIDGNVYFRSYNLANVTLIYLIKDYAGSVGGTGGLGVNTDPTNAGHYVDKRGLDFKVEIRMTDVPGTNQRLRCWCVRETLEIT